MSAKARLWIGVTLLLVLVINYVMIGLPLLKKTMSIQTRYKALLIKEAKSGALFKGSEDEYLLEIFRKEQSSVARKIIMLNCVSLTLLIFIISWTVFGLLFHRRL